MAKLGLLANLLGHAATGDQAGARCYLATMYPNGSDLAEVRALVRDYCTADFATLLLALPCMAAQSFKRDDYSGDSHGIPRASFSLDKVGLTLLRLVATGDEQEWRRYLPHVVRGDADLVERLRKKCTAEFLALWPEWAGEQSRREGQNVRAMLELAGPHGLPASELDAVQMAGLFAADEIAEFNQATGGRPRRMVRLKSHDTRFNPFAISH